MAFFLISNMVLGLFGQLQIFLQLYLIELLGLFFSVIDSFKWFWMGSILHKKIQLLLEFLKAPVLVLHFSYYALMTFLMILSVILLSMLMILPVLSVIRHLIRGNNFNWPLDLNLIYETLWTGARSGFLISMLEKLKWFRLTGLITLLLFMWKWMHLFLRKRSSFKMMGLTFSPKLDWGSYIISIAKTASKKIGAIIPSMKFLSCEVAL